MTTTKRHCSTSTNEYSWRCTCQDWNTSYETTFYHTPFKGGQTPPPCIKRFQMTLPPYCAPKHSMTYGGLLRRRCIAAVLITVYLKRCCRLFLQSATPSLQYATWCHCTQEMVQEAANRPLTQRTCCHKSRAANCLSPPDIVSTAATCLCL
jgi:hypothetical protein